MDEYAVLRGDAYGYHDTSTVDGSRLISTMNSLLLRGCVTMHVREDGVTDWWITRLGLLARKFARPEMAFPLP